VSLTQHYRAKELVRTNQIRPISVNDTLIIFETDYQDQNYSIIYKKKEGRWSCTCKGFSAFLRGKDCTHIKACKLLIKQ